MRSGIWEDLLNHAACWSSGTAMASNVDNDPQLIKLNADISTL